MNPIVQRAAQALLLSGLVAAAAVAQAQQVLKLSSFESATGTITSKFLAPLAKDITEASNGTLRIDIYAGGTLGRSPTQQLKLVTDGIADLAWVVLAYTPGRFDDTEVVGLPFVSRNGVEASTALQRLLDNGSLVGFQDLKMVAIGASPPLVIHANAPLRLPGDLKGKRVRLSGDHMAKVVQALGGAPVQVAGGQIAEAMSKGVVDMTLNNWGFVGDFKVDEVSSYHLEVPLGAVAVGVVMRRDRYEALPPAARQAIDRFSGASAAQKLGLVFDQLEDSVRARVSKSGRNTVVVPSEADIDAWRKAIEPVNLAWRNAKPRNERTYQAFTAEIQKVRAGGKP